MNNLNIDDLRPGDKVHAGDEILTVLAKMGENALLVSDGRIVEFDRVGGVYEVCLDVKFAVFGLHDIETFREHGQPVFDVKELKVGDILIDISGYIGEYLTVAVIDKPRNTAYSQGGEMLLTGGSIYVKTGWRMYATDLLTEHGRESLRLMYE